MIGTCDVRLPIFTYTFHYCLVLWQRNLLTHETTTDVEDTIDAIVSASVLPLTIVIVGVGGANFEKLATMCENADKLVSSTGVLLSWFFIIAYGNNACFSIHRTSSRAKERDLCSLPRVCGRLCFCACSGGAEGWMRTHVYIDDIHYADVMYAHIFVYLSYPVLL